MGIKNVLIDLANESLLNQSQFLVDVVVSSRNLSKITVIVDGDKGISINDCSQISRVISEKIDKLDLSSHPFSLEVTTPGLDHPLKMKRQYDKNIGRKLKIHKKDGEIVEGILNSVNQDGILISEEKLNNNLSSQEGNILSFNELEKVFVMISFKN